MTEVQRYSQMTEMSHKPRKGLSHAVCRTTAGPGGHLLANWGLSLAVLLLGVRLVPEDVCTWANAFQLLTLRSVFSHSIHCMPCHR